MSRALSLSRYLPVGSLFPSSAYWQSVCDFFAPTALSGALDTCCPNKEEKEKQYYERWSSFFDAMQFVFGSQWKFFKDILIQFLKFIDNLHIIGNSFLTICRYFVPNTERNILEILLYIEDN